MGKKKVGKKTKFLLSVLAVPPPPPFKQLAEKIFKKHGAKVPWKKKVPTKRAKPVVRRKPIPPPPTKPVPENAQFNDEIGISQKRLTSNYNPVQLRGFSENRPEILCITDFLPAYDRTAYVRQRKNDRSMLPVGEKLKVMLALGRLRNYNIKQLLESLREDEDAAKIIDDIERQYDIKIKDAIEDIRALTALMINLEKARDALNVRKSQRKIMAKIGRRTNSDTTPLGYQDILGDMGFNRRNIPEFSNTKILMQIIHDFNMMISNYSPGLLGIENPARRFDDDEFDIIKNIYDPKREPDVPR